MSLSPARYDEEAWEGRDWSRPYQLPEGFAEDYTGASVVATIKFSFNDTEPVAEIVAPVDVDGAFSLSIAAAEMMDANRYVWDAYFTTGGEKNPLWNGLFRVNESVGE